MSHSPPDADIADMRRLAAGDDVALNDIMRRWQEKVAAFLQRMTGNPTVAVDLAQETFVRLYQHRGSYSPKASFATYLFRIAANLARNHQRWLRRHPTVAIDDENVPVHELASAEETPDGKAEKRERLQIVESALAALPEELREAMLLFTHEDMSHAEIARIAGCSPKAVETRIYRARQILRNLLKDLDD
ncbi:MAG: sigma-70 family RNA polymerase sigma factor [Verrucomicrobiaceae bacterium]